MGSGLLRSRIGAFVCLFIASTLFGCPQKTGGSSPDHPPLCVDDSQCPAGYLCRGAVCQPAPSCANGETCPDGLTCNQLTGECETGDAGSGTTTPDAGSGCAEDCAAPQFCNVSTGQCVYCSSSNPCPDGGVCSGTGTNATCGLAEGCTTTVDCETADPGTVCQGGTCTNCTATSDCSPYGSTYTCQSGLCSMNSSCDIPTCNSTCAAETPPLVCDTSTCGCMQGSSSCTDSNCGGEPCTSPSTCDANTCTCTVVQTDGGTNGMCTNTMCTSSSDCCSGWTCINILLGSYCGQNCTSDSDCQSGDPCCMDLTGDQVCQVGLGATCLGSTGGGGNCGTSGMNDATCTTTADCVNAGCSADDICVSGECNEEALDMATGNACTYAECQVAGTCVGAISNAACTCSTATANMAAPIPCQ